MEQYEMAELLRDKAKVSYDEARKALEKSDWDMLRAMVALEQEGKLGAPHDAGSGAQGAPQDKPRTENVLIKALNWFTGLIDKGNQHRFIIEKDDRQAGSMTVTVFVVLLLMLHGFTFFLLLLGLLMGYRYRFVSAAQIKEARNAATEAEQAAQELEDRHTVNSFGGDMAG